MNISQRIVLVVGAIAFAVVLLTVPKYVDCDSIKIEYGRWIKELKAKSEHGEKLDSFQENLISSLSKQPDLTIAAIRVIAVVGTTFLLYFAVGRMKQKTAQNLAEQSGSSVQADLFGYVQPVIRPIFFPKKRLRAQTARLQIQVDELKDNIEVNESQIAELQEEMEEISRIVKEDE